MPDSPTNSDLLPTQQANNFTFALNGNEFLVAFGVSRLSITPPGSTPEHHVEWVAALSISPMAAAQLHEVLGANLRTYEAKFGKIPKDQSFKINQSG